MTINSIPTKRTAVLRIETIGIDQPQLNRGRSSGTGIIVAIEVTVDDGTQVTEYNFSNASEINLLREFWHVILGHDVFVGHSIANQLAFLRRRSWDLGLIPSREIDLCTVYQHQTLDPASLRLMTGGTEYGSAEALIYIFGLPGKTPEIQPPLSSK
jgi:hypothetical protein